MASIRNSSQITVEFKDWTDLTNPSNKNSQCFRVVMLHMYERLGGEIASGTMELWVDGYADAMKYVTDKNDGTILLVDEKEEGLNFEIPIYITDRSYMGNNLTISFKCIKDINFYLKPISTFYKDGIKKAIEATYPGKQDIRIEPGVTDTVLFQNEETNYEFNKRLAYSYKTKSIFAYGFEGLLIKDLCGEKDSQGNTEPKLKIKEGKLIQQSETFDLKYDITLNHDSYDPFPAAVDECTTKTDHSADESQNARVNIDYQDYTVVGKDLEAYQMNLNQNTNLMNSGCFTQFRTESSDMPSYKLGDVLIYTKIKHEDENVTLPFKNFLVAGNEIFYSTDGCDKVNYKGMKFSWTTLFYGLEDGLWAKDKE